jgi:hypothetical protein
MDRGALRRHTPAIYCLTCVKSLPFRTYVRNVVRRFSEVAVEAKRFARDDMTVDALGVLQTANRSRSMPQRT